MGLFEMSDENLSSDTSTSVQYSTFNWGFYKISRHVPKSLATLNLHPCVRSIKRHCNEGQSHLMVAGRRRHVHAGTTQTSIRRWTEEEKENHSLIAGVKTLSGSRTIYSEAEELDGGGRRDYGCGAG